MATMGVAWKRAASSISLSTSIPRSPAAASSGLSRGTPGLGTTASTPSSQAGRSAPKWQSAASSDSSLRTCGIRSSSRASTATTRAPRPARNRATARPVRASPSTMILLLRRSISGFPLVTGSMFIISARLTPESFSATSTCSARPARK